MSTYFSYRRTYAGLLMVADLMKRRKGRITLGADKAYDTQDFCEYGAGTAGGAARVAKQRQPAERY